MEGAVQNVGNLGPGFVIRASNYPVSAFRYFTRSTLFHSSLWLLLGFQTRAEFAYSQPMPLIRILVDGYSLLHNWPQLAPGKARHSAAARQELIHVLTQYQDAAKTPVTIIFDGAGAPPGTPKNESKPAIEVLYSPKGKTADDLIERAAYRLSAYGPVLVVTDDFAERDTVATFGGLFSSCAGFIQTVGAALDDLQSDLRRYNLAERNRFNRSR
jgi:uncharacterized protein